MNNRIIPLIEVQDRHMFKSLNWNAERSRIEVFVMDAHDPATITKMIVKNGQRQEIW